MTDDVGIAAADTQMAVVFGKFERHVIFIITAAAVEDLNHAHAIGNAVGLDVGAHTDPGSAGVARNRECAVLVCRSNDITQLQPDL